MTILHVIPFLWSGAGRVVTRLCLEQSAQHVVHIVTTAAGHGARDWPGYRAQLKGAGVRHHRIDTYARDNATFWGAVQSLRTLIARERPDIIHAHAGTATGACVIAARRTPLVSVPVVAQIYSWGRERPAWMDEMDVWAFSEADLVIGSARGYLGRLLQGGVRPKRLLYIPWGVDRPAPPPAIASVSRRLGFVGRIEPRKGQLLLARAVALLGRHTPTRLDLVGPVADPAYAEALDAVIAGSPRAATIRRWGRVREIGPLLGTWQLFVSLSDDEGQGLAVLEAMAAGVPVAAWSVPGIEDYLEDGRTGLVLQRGGPRAIAAQLDAALGDQARLRAMAHRAQRMVRHRYDWTRTLRQIELAYARARRSAAGRDISAAAPPA